MKQNKASVCYICYFQMPFIFVAVPLSYKIFPLWNAGNLRFVILPRQFNRVTDEFALAFEFTISSIREISSRQPQNHLTFRSPEPMPMDCKHHFSKRTFVHLPLGRIPLPKPKTRV